MIKPLQEITFRPVDGVWMDAEGHVLADVLALYEIVVDDRCQFARLYDYERVLVIYYRASAGKITLTIWRMGKGGVQPSY